MIFINLICDIKHIYIAKNSTIDHLVSKSTDLRNSV